MPMAQQLARMAQHCPSLPMTSWRSGVVQWTGELQPADMTERYRVEIRYRLGRRPEVRVLNPVLQNQANGARVPHLFPDDTLCLYLTNSGEWSASQAIAETTVPWTSLWLYHYEVWHAIGEWMGGGVHPPRKKSH
jgi:hypothetical protein